MPESSASTPRISLRDLARSLDVSPSTISRALRNHPRISKALSEKIRAAATRAGYRPDPMLSALAEYRRAKTSSGVKAELAWINHWPVPAELRSFREFDLYWQGAREAALRNGYHLEQYEWNQRGLSLSRLRQILRARNVRGILIPPHPGVPLDWGDFEWDDFCVVRFGHSVAAPHTHVVTSNQLLNARIAVRRMRLLGYRRVGFVSNQSMVANTLALAGYLMEQNAAPDPAHPPRPLIMPADASARAAKTMLKTWLARQRPDAILSDVGEVRDMLAILGTRVPDEIGLATMSVLDGGADAGIDQRSLEIGRAAAEVLASRIQNNDTGIPATHRETLIEGAWVDGQTLPARIGRPGKRKN